MLFKNVLVGIDGKPNGRDAIALARSLSSPEAKLTLAHIHSGELHPSNAITPGLVREERKASQELLEQERAAAGVDAELISVVAMNPGRGLHQRTEEQGADLLVVGSCSRGALGRAMLGDDTRAALNGAPCAVAVASLGYAERTDSLAKIGVGYNGTPESKAALALARELATESEATLHALDVVSIPTAAFTGIVPPALGDGVELMLQEAASRMKALPDLDGHAVYGLPGEELALFSGKMDLLVIGSRGYGPVRRLMFGSTSNYLERHARCSLLVLSRTAGETVADGEPSRDTQAVAV